MAAGLFMAAYSLGTFIGPTLGGLLFDYLVHTPRAAA